MKSNKAKKSMLENKKTADDGFYTDRKDRHFRGMKNKVNDEVKVHPKYIIGEDKNNYSSLGITHSPSKGRKHNNHELHQNPDPKDSRKAYMRKKIEKVKKIAFEKTKSKRYQLSSKDDDYVDSLIEKQRNYRKQKTKK